MPKVHWKLYFTRKVLILVGVVVATSYAQEYFHVHTLGRIHEFGLSFLFEHLLFGIPFHGE
jgi:hypothetical protein